MIQEILCGIIIAGVGYLGKSHVDLRERMTRVETIQRFQLKHNGFSDKDIDVELDNHNCRRKKK